MLDGTRCPVIHAGMLRIGANAMEGAKPLDVEATIVHPDWLEMANNQPRTNFDNDIALVKLAKPLTMGPTISPICLPGASSDYDLPKGILGYISGWGKTPKTGAAIHLRYARIPVVNMDRCRSVRPDPPLDSLTYVFTDNMICGGGNGKDSCDGDSGGAFAVKYHHDELHYYVAGLVSWGPKCGTYGLYTKVSNYVDWITNVMSQNETRRMHSCL